MESFEELLVACDVRPTTLDRAEAAALDGEGYVVLDSVVDEAWLQRLRAAFEAASARPDADAGRTETGTQHSRDLAHADPVFEGVLLHPRVLAAVHHVLQRPFQLLFLSGRDPLPGYGQQGLHTDWTPRAPHTPFDVVTALWPLDGFTRESGPTRVLPGSHLVPRALPKPLQAPRAHHPDERLVLVPAGSVLVLNGHLWHSGTRNTSQGPRRALQCLWVARDRARPAGAPAPVPAWLGAAARALLGC